MLFLLNDLIFSLSVVELTPPVSAGWFRSVSLGFVRGLGAELYAEQPRLQIVAPERARRLAVLIAAKAPEVNAAHFAAPAFACAPGEVVSRFAQIGFDAMVGLYDRQRKGEFDAEQEVWRLMTAGAEAGRSEISRNTAVRRRARSAHG
jgi:hypothetical protein